MNKNIKVLKLYRKLLYTMMDVFKGDYETFHILRITIRREIEKRRDLTDEKEIREKILDLEECRNAILTEIMQGKLQDGGFYRFKARPENFVGANPKIIDKFNKI
jgi:hypothetical protein